MTKVKVNYMGESSTVATDGSLSVRKALELAEVPNPSATQVVSGDRIIGLDSYVQDGAILEVTPTSAKVG